MNQTANYKNKVLIADDEETSQHILAALVGNLGFKVDLASNRQQTLELAACEHFDLIFLDYKLGDDNGLDVLKELLDINPTFRVIMVTAYGNINVAVESMRSGAVGFISKPVVEESVNAEVKRALKNSSESFKSKANNKLAFEMGIIGKSPAIKKVSIQIEKMKDVPTTVLISGESGTGKELIAKALHYSSIRKKERFEAINCAAIPETLLEAELFGYRKGAFTDAKSDRIGLFEACSEGTLFLDEIGELSLSLQTKLLRVLQEKELTPLGASSAIKVNTRVVAATNQNLKKLVASDQFRKDLFYRLSILEIESPPLRERAEDIDELAVYFIEKLSKELGKVIKPVTSELLAKLRTYDWPGNIRELQNSIERAIVLSENGILNVDDIIAKNLLVGQFAQSEVGIKSFNDAKSEFEEAYLRKLLSHTNGNVSDAARIADRTRTDLYRLFSKYDILPSDFK